ncbi:extracellular protein [Apiospora rasikravindrae]|uniref:Extracellular protein n=1 Tax=Apiospora rasikravindrae TaxID=990691 RepID=A0ABR1SIR7_9PEZI
MSFSAPPIAYISASILATGPETSAPSGATSTRRPLTANGLKQTPSVPCKRMASRPAGVQKYESGYSGGAKAFCLLWSEGTCCGFDKTKPAPAKSTRPVCAAAWGIAGPYVDRQGKRCTAASGSTVVESCRFAYGLGG